MELNIWHSVKRRDTRSRRNGAWSRILTTATRVRSIKVPRRIGPRVGTISNARLPLAKKPQAATGRGAGIGSHRHEPLPSLNMELNMEITPLLDVPVGAAVTVKVRGTDMTL